MIKVIDSIMGAGKSSYVIQMMNEETDKRYLYISPLLSEVERVLEACSERGFVQPRESEGNNKSEDLYKLLVEGRNIASTHALFQLIDKTALDVIKAKGYTLIMDEVMDVVEPVKLDKRSLNALFDREILLRGDAYDADGKVVQIEAGPEKRLNKYETIRQQAELERLVLVNDTALMWLFPPRVFEVFEEIFNLTYLFDGQIMKAYYDMHGLDFEKFSVIKNQESGRYKLTQHSPNHDAALKASIREFVSVYQGRLNDIGRDLFDLSKGWYQKRGNLQKLKASIATYFRHYAAGGSLLNMWTTFKDFKARLTGNGYAKGFVPCNARATNDFHEKANLAYLVNRFVDPSVIEYFRTKNICIDSDLLALSEMVQWIWRSRIRKMEGINVYIPSSRMRFLLNAWMDHCWTPEQAASRHHAS